MKKNKRIELEIDEANGIIKVPISKEIENVEIQKAINTLRWRSAHQGDVQFKLKSGKDLFFFENCYFLTPNKFDENAEIYLKTSDGYLVHIPLKNVDYWSTKTYEPEIRET